MKIFYKLLLFLGISALVPLVFMGLLVINFQQGFIDSELEYYLDNQTLFNQNIPVESKLVFTFDESRGDVVGENVMKGRNVYKLGIVEKGGNYSAPVSIDLGGVEFRGFCHQGVSDVVCRLIDVSFIEEDNRAISLMRTLLVSVIVLCVIVILMAFLLGKFIASPIERLSEYIKGLPEDVYQYDLKINSRDEVGHLNEMLAFYFKKLDEHQGEMRSAIRSEAYLELSKSVAHDIRSPLAALEVVFRNVESIDEENRILVRGAITRIKDIAHRLLREYKESRSEVESIDVKSQMLPALLNSIISEKRLEYTERLDVGIQLRERGMSYGVFTEVSGNELQTHISNIINNGVEALDAGGDITVYIEATSAEVAIVTEDNGRGMSEELLANLGESRSSSNKKEGMGLGVYNAKKYFESQGGRVEINSQEGKGTTVRAILKRSDSPDWFCPEIALEGACKVVIVDDDQSIHKLWKNRFEAIRDEGVEFIHFADQEQFINSVQCGEILADRYFVDYEFAGTKTTGLDLVKRLGIADRSTLVTSHFEDDSVIDQVVQLKMKLIPKEQVSHIPISIVKS